MKTLLIIASLIIIGTLTNCEQQEVSPKSGTIGRETVPRATSSIETVNTVTKGLALNSQTIELELPPM